MRPHFKQLAIAVLSCAFMVPQLKAQVPVALMPIPRVQFADNNGVPLAGGCVSFFSAGTTTPAPTYVDITGLILTTNPVVLDSAGRATIYGANQEYKVQLNAAPATGTCSSVNLGALIWVQDNVSPFQVVVGTQTIIFAGVTVDPTGQAGMMDYRSDIPCFRTFTTIWDCLVRLNDTQTLTNKSLVSPTITGTIGGNPTITAPTINGGSILAAYTNEGVTGTATNTLTKLTGSPAVAIKAAITDTGGIIGICVSGCSTGGSSQISTTGIASCVFDGGTTAGDLVIISPSAPGDCRDNGSPAFPTSGQIIGRVMTTNGPAGTYAVSLFSQEIRGIPSLPASPTEVFTTASASTNTSIGVTSMLITSGVSVTARFGAYITQTVLGIGCSTNTTITLNLLFKDPNASSTQTQSLATFTIVNNGTLGLVSVTTNTNLPMYIRTAATQTTSYSTSYVQGTCTTGPSYQVFPMLEQF